MPDPLPRRLRGLPRSVEAEWLVPWARVYVATTFRARLLGLAGLDPPSERVGLLLPRTRSVHTFGMRVGLDLLWIDAAGRRVGVDTDVPPGRIRACRAARAVIEVPAAPLWLRPAG